MINNGWSKNPGQLYDHTTRWGPMNVINRAAHCLQLLVTFSIRSRIDFRFDNHFMPWQRSDRISFHYCNFSTSFDSTRPTWFDRVSFFVIDVIYEFTQSSKPPTECRTALLLWNGTHQASKQGPTWVGNRCRVVREKRKQLDLSLMAGWGMERRLRNRPTFL